MTELQEKYKDDPARMNTEMMKLYKDYGVNPLSGCLPMLIQIPIFFGFYNMLGKAVELRNSQLPLGERSLAARHRLRILARHPGEHPAAAHGRHDALADGALAEVRRSDAAAHVHVHAADLHLLLLQLRLRPGALLDGAEHVFRRAALRRRGTRPPRLCKSRRAAEEETAATTAL